jgi:hypothetical protein
MYQNLLVISGSLSNPLILIGFKWTFLFGFRFCFRFQVWFVCRNIFTSLVQDDVWPSIVRRRCNNFIVDCEWLNSRTHYRKLIYRVFSAQADWTLTDRSHKDTEHNRSFYHTRWRNTDWPTDQVITEWLTFSLPIRCSGRLISRHNEHPVQGRKMSHCMV